MHRLERRNLIVHAEAEICVRCAVNEEYMWPCQTAETEGTESKLNGTRPEPRAELREARLILLQYVWPQRASPWIVFRFLHDAFVPANVPEWKVHPTRERSKALTMCTPWTPELRARPPHETSESLLADATKGSVSGRFRTHEEAVGKREFLSSQPP